MTERVATQMKEIPELRTTFLMTLPEDTERTRISMHSDTLGLMIRFLRSLPPELQEKMYIQGRDFPDQETYDRLKEHPVHRFYRQQRKEPTAEAAAQKAREAGIDLPLERLIELAHSPYSPATLKDAIGYDLAWFNVSDVVRMAEKEH